MRFFSDANFRFLPIPTEIHFGLELVGQLPALLRQRQWLRVFVVTDPGVRRAGLVEQLTQGLSKEGLSFDVYDQVTADSGSRLIEEATRQARQFGPEAVLGLGGGSSLDTAKAVALMVNAPEPLMNYVGLGNVKHCPIPIVAVPTTAGTGSEVTLWSVFASDETGVKVAIGSVELYPKLAVCDPLLTLSLPPALTASTGMDALTHAIECYTNNACQPISGSLALTAIELIGANLCCAVLEGQTNLHARYQVLLASTMAGIAMNSTRLGLAHALAMPLGSQPFCIPHGLANAITLPHVMEFNCAAEPERFASVASVLGEANGGHNLAARAAEAVRKLASDIGIPSGLSAVGFREEAIPAIVAEAIKSGNVAVNPRPARPEDVEKILRAAL